MGGGTDEPEVEEDDWNEDPPKKANSQEGEIYQLGEHRLMCGDSTNPDHVRELMGGATADMLLTDPPYNVAYGSQDNIHESVTRENHHREDGDGSYILNDSMSNEEFENFLTSMLENAKAQLKDGGAFYVWYASRMELYLLTAMIKAGLNVRQVLIWVKTHFTLGRQDYQWIHEPCLYGWKDGAGHYFTEDRTQATVIDDQLPDFKKMSKTEMQNLLTEIYTGKTPTDVIRAEKPAVSDLHPTMKPLKLMGKLIGNSSRKGETVLDLFGGSGSTLIACEQMDRRCFTMELDPVYVDVIIRRWEKFTGKKAVKLN